MTELEQRQGANIVLVRAALDSFSAGDVEALRSMMRPDSEISSDAMGINTGTFHGYEGYLTWVGRWLEAWEEFKLEVKEIEPIGERHVVATMHQSATGKGSGIPVELDVAYVWEVRDRKIAAMHLFPGRDEALRVAERRETKAPEYNPPPP